MTSYLCLTSATKTQCADVTSALNLDVLAFNVLEINSEDGKDIGIDKAKEVAKFTHKAPMTGSKKLAIIYDAHKLTIEAQNALLKTLEEHPEYIDMVLVTRSEGGLAETVISRCKKVVLASKAKKKGSKDSLSNILEMDTGARVTASLKLSKKDKKDIIEILHTWVEEAHEMERYETAGTIVNTLNDLENTNVNTRLALEVLMFKLS